MSSSRLLHLGRFRIREEQLFAVDIVGPYRVLALRREDPINECLTELLLDVRMLGRIDENDTVLVD